MTVVSVAQRRAGLGRSLAAVASVVAVATSVVWFGSADCLRAFFHFDDYWVLQAASRIELDSIADLAAFFEPINGFLLYRPLSTLAYFFGLRMAFGHDPVAYHAVQMAFQVVNTVLVYSIADRILFTSRLPAVAVAVLYLTAPGHAIATCWNALFTMTGAAFFYFLGLWAWVGIDGRARGPLALLCFCATLLSSEHGVTFPLAVSAVTCLLYPRSSWRHGLWAQAAMHVLAAGYVIGKLYYVREILPNAALAPMARALALQGYAPQLDPAAAIGQLGTYLGFASGALYTVVAMGAWIKPPLGLALILAWVLATSAVLLDGRSRQPVRLVAFGLSLFGIALGPVLLLPNHVYSYYVGIAALGFALAVVGATGLLPRAVRQAATWLLIPLALAVYATTIGTVRQSEEFRFFRSFTTASARWLYSVSVATSMESTNEVVVPHDALTDMVFNRWEAHRVLLCARYDVRTAERLDIIPSAPRRAVILRPLDLPGGAQRPWAWLPRHCRR